GFLKSFQRFANGELGGTPLLLTIAAIVYYQSGSLPVRRSELYRQFVDDTWREALRRGGHGGLGPEVVELAPGLIPLSLKRIARTMTETQGQGSALDFGVDIKKLTDSLVDLLIATLQLPQTIAAIRAERLTHFLGNRSGVFRASVHQCEWFHPTFREF